MSKKPKKTTWQTHVYLSEDERSTLEAIASKQSRSITKQISFILKQYLYSQP